MLPCCVPFSSSRVSLPGLAERGSWQARYLSAPKTAASLYVNSRASRSAGTDCTGLSEEANGTHAGAVSPSPCASPSYQTTVTSRNALPLRDISATLFEECLSHFYTGSSLDEGVAVLFDGFDGAARSDGLASDRTASLNKLREVRPTTSGNARAAS